MVKLFRTIRAKNDTVFLFVSSFINSFCGSPSVFDRFVAEMPVNLFATNVAGAITGASAGLVDPGEVNTSASKVLHNYPPTGWRYLSNDCRFHYWYCGQKTGVTICEIKSIPVKFPVTIPLKCPVWRVNSLFAGITVVDVPTLKEAKSIGESYYKIWYGSVGL